MLFFYLQKLFGVACIFLTLSFLPGEENKNISRNILKRFKNTIKNNWLTLLIAIVIFSVFTQVNIASDSMEPTLMTGDRGVLVDTVFGYKPVRGDIVGFMRGSQIWVKRVIGLPGDTVEIHNGCVYVNGELLNEDYLVDGLFTAEGKQSVYEVPEGYIFLMGDNRDCSNDARYWEDS